MPTEYEKKMAIAQPSTLTLTDSADLERALETDLPVLLIVSNGETLKADVRAELDKAATENPGRLLIINADASKAPEIAERFELGKHPVMIAWFNGEVLTRRPRPWNTDVPGIVEMLLTHSPVPKTVVDKNFVANKPVTVTDDTFQQEVMDSELPVLVDFWAEWCGPCKQVAPVLEKLAKEFAGKIRVAKVDVDANPGLSQGFRIQSIPTLMFVKSGKIVGQQAGALPEHVLRNAIQQLISLAV
jgi:thioredoxin 1